ncbi:MAG: ABC transporter ATP-binding protein [Gemmatimonadales bacterium]
METLRRLLPYLRPYRGLFALSVVTTLLASVLDGFTVVVLVPLLKHLFGTAGVLRTGSTQLEELMDRVIGPLLSGASPDQAVARIVVILVVGLLLKNAMAYATTQLRVRIQEGLVRDIRVDLFRHLLVLPLGFFQRTRGGQIVSTVITEVDQAKGVVTASLTAFFENLVVIAVTLVVLGLTSWRLTLVFLAAAPILVIGIQALLQRLRRHSRARAKERGSITAYLAERMGAIKLIRGYGEEERESASFDSQADTYRKRVIRTQRYSSLTSPVSEVFGGLMLILVIWAATKPGLVGGPPLTAEATIVFLVAALRLMRPLKALSQFPAALALALGSAEQVFSLLDTAAGEAPAPGEGTARFQRELAFEGVGFSYDGEQPVLRDVSFTLPRGRVAALVGPSGAGKTTLADLLPRFYDPTGGRIAMDGVPLTRLSRGSIRDLMGIVGQETVLLNDTVHVNIAYGSPEATRAEVEAAAKAANADDFIRQLPEGYDTMLGERGTRLSGGQRQRIAIARALLRDSPILILDEATSALDTESERLVQQAIDRLMADRTVLVIAHRLATVRNADEILVLEEGRLTEQGPHDQLYARGGTYRRLYDLQFQEPLAEEAAT